MVAQGNQPEDKFLTLNEMMVGHLIIEAMSLMQRIRMLSMIQPSILETMADGLIETAEKRKAKKNEGQGKQPKIVEELEGFDELDMQLIYILADYAKKRIEMDNG